jgi:hypothetical protein
MLGCLPLAVAFGSNAQQPGKIPVVGMIWLLAGKRKKTLGVGYLRKVFADPSTGLLD